MAKSFDTLSVEVAQRLDTVAQQTVGIPLCVLMENAGSAVAREALRILKRRKRVAVFCGKGNNGGDGLVAARHLLLYGVQPDIFLIVPPDQLSQAASLNAEILIRLKQKVRVLTESVIKTVQRNSSRYDLIIDALLGIGLRGNIGGLYGQIIDFMNQKKAHVLSVDIPSGLHADTGKVLQYCVQADTTVTFIGKKRGMERGKAYCGKVIVAHIGCPFDIKKRQKRRRNDFDQH